MLNNNNFNQSTTISNPPTQQETKMSQADYARWVADVVTDVADGVRYTLECSKKKDEEEFYRLDITKDYSEG